MVATFWLLSCVLVPAQPLPRPDFAPSGKESQELRSTVAGKSGEGMLVPRLGKGQELAYRGSFTEESSSARVQFTRAYRFEARFFVLEASSKGLELVALTQLQSKEAVPSSRHDSSSALSVRLERLHRTEQGKLSGDEGVSLLPVLDGPPTLEVGIFVEVPPGRIQVNQTWEVTEVGRPPMVWRLVGQEPLNGQICLKLQGVQRSADWNRPRADRSAWQRQDTLWISPRTGLTARLERIIESREPARQEPTRRTVLRCELETSLQYPPQLAEDRRQELLQALSFRDALRPLLSEPGRNQRALQTLQRRISYHLEQHPPTPYREAIRLVQRQAEAAARGEVVTVAYQTPVEEPQQQRLAQIGEPAPDFVATELTGNGTMRLARFKGKPLLLVFYNPTSFTARETLGFAQSVQTQFGKYVHVVGLSVSDDRPLVVKMHKEQSLGFPVLYGGGMRISYAVETTPKLVLVDGAGIVRGQYLGWGAETAGEVLSELRRWITAP